VNDRRCLEETTMQPNEGMSRRTLMKATGAAGVAALSLDLLDGRVSAAPASAPRTLRSGKQPTGEVVVSLKNGIVRQDPTLTGSVSDIAVNFQVLETLVDQPERPGEFVGVLAESWSNPDELTWEFKLREGITFHNGEPFNSDSVVATFERWLNPEVGAPMGPILYPEGIIDEVVAIDDTTVQIKTTKPFGGLLSSLLLTYIMPAEATRAAGVDPVPEVIGTGPFRMTEWVQSDHINLVANENYWGEPAKIQSLVYRHVTEDATRLAALRAGEIDILDEMSQDQMVVLEGEEGFYTLTQQTVESLYPVFNTLIPPFDNVLMRQAFNYGVDMGTIVEALIGPGAARQVAPISPQVFAFNDGLSPYDYDPEKARALMEEAGYGDGVDVTFVVPGTRYPAGADIAQAIAASAAEVGFNVTVEVPETNAGFDMVTNARDKWNLFQWGISAVTADPDFPLRWFFRTRDAEPYNGTSATTYSNTEVDRLLDEGAATIDPEVRADLYKQAQALIWDEAAALWQHHVVDIYGVNDRIKGLTLRPDKRPKMSEVYIEE
jgi:peptide/nickel transport system substrate-binding protein